MAEGYTLIGIMKNKYISLVQERTKCDKGERIMENKFMNGLRQAASYALTENGAVTYTTTNDALCDLFGMGAAYRTRSDEDCVFLFKKAYDADPIYALRCLFYIRDIRGGQGERRFFRVCMRWLATYDRDAVVRNLEYFPEFGRYDDLFCLMGTPVEANALAFMKHQLAIDATSYQASPKTAVSLLAKWMPSENASSIETKKLAAKVRRYLGMTAKQYRKTLSALRERINVLERLMSANEWDKIEFDKIPSKAGLKYRNAFARHDVERAQAGARTYESFIKDENTKVNAGALYPYEVVEKAIKLMNPYGLYYSYNSTARLDDTERLAVNKYWDNLTDYFKDATFNGLAVVDTSGSMCGTPINVAISLGMYCAERAKGPFAGHYVSFSSRPQLIKVDGVDFCDKVSRIYRTNLCQNTNIEATFHMLLNTAIKNHCSQADLPENIIVISDMEFDRITTQDSAYMETLMEAMRRTWQSAGYKMPNLVFWNVNARNDRIPMKLEHGVTFVSGFSPSLFKQIMTGKTAYDLVMETLNQERYSVIK